MSAFQTRSEVDLANNPFRVELVPRVVVHAGAVKEEVEVGQKRTLRVGASKQELQRIKLNDRMILVSVPVGSMLSLQPDPCAVWQLSSKTLGPETAVPPNAYCKQQGKECRKGFLEVSQGLPTNDRMCPATGLHAEVRAHCVRPGLVRFRNLGDQPATLEWDPAVDKTEKIVFGPRGYSDAYAFVSPACQFPQLHWNNQKVELAIGVGEKWTIVLDEHAEPTIRGVR
jgi:hypothetical protein